MKYAWHACLALGFCCTAAGSEAGFLRKDHADMQTGVRVRTELTNMVADMVAGRGPGPADISKLVHKKMDLSTALRQLHGKLPRDVASLIHLTASGKASGQFDEDSMQKARKILNNMMLTAWGELDDVIFECKEFQERNRGTYEQVVTDLARLASQLSRLGELQVSSQQGIQDRDAARKRALDKLDDINLEYKKTSTENGREMTIRRNDLAVFDFILQATACKDGQNFIQLNTPNMQICQTTNGPVLNFKDRKLQARLEQMMTPESRQALRTALGQVQQPLGLIQLQEDPAPQFIAKTVPVSEEPSPNGQWKKCVDGEPNCGLLHDIMSIEWGKFRDSFDDLTAEMAQNKQEYERATESINVELEVISDEKTKHMEVLANTISNINADTEESNEKEEQKLGLEHEFALTCKRFKEKIAEILFTRICAVRRVRNELLEKSTLTPPSKFSDCDFSDWHSKFGKCIAPNGDVIQCDDSCPKADPYKCGGFETMKRDIVVLPDDNGMQCPQLERKKKCGQKKCPVDCEMSKWSGWSKCTKDCESGVQGKTRSVVVKPKHGGRSCDAVGESRPCNTGSCDRNCKLSRWSEWSPCSQACDGGITKRKKKVIVPIRGEGKCPKSKSPLRFEDKKCNTQPCVGDEICIAKQDLVIALDASGSLRESGYEIVRSFAVNLTKRYKSKYFGAPAIKMGVSLFGNGHLIELKGGGTTIQAAINLQPLTFDLKKVGEEIGKTKWQRGFTNMAQAFATADTILGQGGREDAQSAVMVISDGKFSFKYQTAEKAQELKDKNIMIYMAPITASRDKSLFQLMKWASQPWRTNYIRIPGLAALQHNNDIFAQKIIVKFCPDAMSPSLRRAKDNIRQYILIHEDGWASDQCGPWQHLGETENKNECAAKARAENMPGFAFGKEFAQGDCYGEVMVVTQKYFEEYQLDPSSPAPACGNADGACPAKCEWLDNPYYDSYVINPSTMPAQGSF